MTAPSAEFAVQVADAVRAERENRIRSLGLNAVTWLAVVPLWTLSVAKAAGFPADDVLDFVKRARDVGWCETRGSLRDGGAGELRFWMPDEQRRAVLQLLDQLLREGTENRLPVEAEIVAQQVSVLGLMGELKRPAAEPVTVPGALANWTSLVRFGTPDVTLVDATRRLVEDGDLSGAQDWVAAGEALAALQGGTMELAVDRARRLFTLGTRRRQDGRALARYLDREELSAAVDRLLRPGTRQWALHLRGAGGVGKTMLIRYLAAGRYATDRDRPPIPIARVDFDHMNPDYPVRRPVQLLLELADELALHTAPIGRADRALSRFRATAASVHESLSSARDEHPEPMRNPRVLAAIDEFAAVLGELPEVLLILDTCEELAKADAGDPAGSPAVENTLAILERIGSRASSVRVLFAGRRPLPPRDYLAVQGVAGFTLDEAGRYLTKFSDRPLAPALADEMIRQSPAIDSPGTRVSPFDLALYLAWANEDPDLDPRRVAAGSDAYIEGRIIERLRDPGVLAALPLLASAGRCRVATIAKFTGATAAALGPRLAEQEWIDHDGDPPLHVAAKPALASRLRHYFGAPTRAAGFASATTALAEALRGQVAAAALEEIDADELLAALRLSETAAAAELWDDLANRAAVAGRWNWLLNVTSRILGESAEERWPTARALRATVLASYIAANRHASPAFNARASWDEVRASAGGHPDPVAGRILLARAALGLLPYTPDDESLLDMLWAETIGSLGSRVQRLELAASAADALDRLLEAGARATAERIVRDDYLGSATAYGLATDRLGGARISAWVFAAVARLYADSGDRQGALNALSTAENQAMRAAAAARMARSDEPAMADWIQPSDLLARVRLERGLIAPPESGVLTTWESYAAGHLDTVDGERLASLCLRTRLGHGIIAPSDIERWEETDRYEPDRLATCSAHDLVPPLFTTLADAWLAAGYPQRALDLLERRRAAALDTRGDDATIRHADAATVRIARRLRLADQRALLARLARGNDPSLADLTNNARRAVVVAYDGRLDWGEAVPGPADWHAWWQTTSLPPPMEPWPAESTETDLAADIELDIEEMRLLGHPAYESVRDSVAHWISRPRPSLVRSADPYQDVRAGLRRAALADDDSHECPPDVPPRAFAEIAFDEAELLALRLPRHAARMFGYAYVAYRTSQDLIGQVLAGASRLAITGNPQDLLATRSAVEDLTASQPEVGAALDGPVTEAGLWRYWAELLERLYTVEDRLVSATALTAERIVGWLVTAIVFCSLIVGGVVAVVEAYREAPEVFTIGLPSLAGVVLAAIALTGNWRLPSVFRVADSRGVGVFNPGVLGFVALIGGAPADRHRVYLWAHVRQLAFAPKRRWLRLALLAFVGALAAPFRRKEQKGYLATFRESLSWETDPPSAAAAWWSAGTMPGVLFMNPSDATQPWERIITASLGPDAAGRVAWCRRANGTVYHRLKTEHDSTVVMFNAPPEWERALGSDSRFITGEQLGTTPKVRDILVRYAMGRAVSTSAGPRLDISGERAVTSSARELLGANVLTLGRPSLIVLQAEPVPDDLAAGELDDLLEKLALATDLMEARDACDVLIVPAVPAHVASPVAALIAEHAARPHGDSRALQAKLRALLRGLVDPAVLDDVVLFWNMVRYK